MQMCERYELVPLIDIANIEITEAEIEARRALSVANHGSKSNLYVILCGSLFNASVFISTSIGDSKLSTVIAQKETAAKSSLIDLARGISTNSVSMKIKLYLLNLHFILSLGRN